MELNSRTSVILASMIVLSGLASEPSALGKKGTPAQVRSKHNEFDRNWIHAAGDYVTLSKQGAWQGARFRVLPLAERPPKCGQSTTSSIGPA